MAKPHRGASASPRRREGSAARWKKPARPNAFLTLIDTTVDAYTQQGNASVQDVERILADVRSQYDQVHETASRRERELEALRESIRQVDRRLESNMPMYSEDEVKAFQRQVADTQALTEHELTNRKVYTHMLDRLQKERSVLRQKLLRMGDHLSRKHQEQLEKRALHQSQRQAQQELALELEQCEYELEEERVKIADALEVMRQSLVMRKQMLQRRSDFQLWRTEVSKEAANEAFQASAGRLRKLWGMEKLGGNCLQKIIFEQVEKSQATEDGFQRIREVTGLTDVMDIVHKFLNRDVEHEQLKTAVKEAESRLDSLRDELELCQRHYEESGGNGHDSQRAVYHEVEEAEVKLNTHLQEYSTSLEKLEKTTILFEQMKAWARRMQKSLAHFEDPMAIENEQHLIAYARQLKTTSDKFLRHIHSESQHLKAKKAARTPERDHHEAGRTLNDKDFLKANARIRVDERPTSARKTEAEDDDELFSRTVDREKLKAASKARVAEVMRRSARQKQAPR